VFLMGAKIFRLALNTTSFQRRLIFRLCLILAFTGSSLLGVLWLDNHGGWPRVEQLWTGPSKPKSALTSKPPAAAKKITKPKKKEPFLLQTSPEILNQIKQERWGNEKQALQSSYKNLEKRLRGGGISGPYTSNRGASDKQIREFSLQAGLTKPPPAKPLPPPPSPEALSKPEEKKELITVYKPDKEEDAFDWHRLKDDVVQASKGVLILILPK